MPDSDGYSASCAHDSPPMPGSAITAPGKHKKDRQRCYAASGIALFNPGNEGNNDEKN